MYNAEHIFYCNLSTIDSKDICTIWYILKVLYMVNNNITVTDLKSCIGGYKTVQITGKCPV